MERMGQNSFSKLKNSSTYLKFRFFHKTFSVFHISFFDKRSFVHTMIMETQCAQGRLLMPPKEQLSTTCSSFKLIDVRKPKKELFCSFLCFQWPSFLAEGVGVYLSQEDVNNVFMVVRNDPLYTHRRWTLLYEDLLTPLTRSMLMSSPMEILHYPWLATDRAFVMELVRRDGRTIGFLDQSFRNEREFVVAAVSTYGIAIMYANESYRADIPVCRLALKSSGRLLKFMTIEVQKDIECVMNAVRSYGLSLRNVDVQHRKQEHVVLAAVHQNGDALQFASSTLRNNAEIVLMAVKQNGLSLRYAGLECRNDETIVLEAVINNGEALEFASPRLQNVTKVAKAAVLNNILSFQFVSARLQFSKKFHSAVKDR